MRCPIHHIGLCFCDEDDLTFFGSESPSSALELISGLASRWGDGLDIRFRTRAFLFFRSAGMVREQKADYTDSEEKKEMSSYHVVSPAGFKFQ
jgi:hypothetical protein